MDAIRGHHVKWNKPGTGRQRPHILSHMWKTDTKDKLIHKNKHDHVQAHMQNMFITVELIYGNWGNENDRVSMVS
jgi:hypothetical protein